MYIGFSICVQWMSEHILNNIVNMPPPSSFEPKFTALAILHNKAIFIVKYCLINQLLAFFKIFILLL